MLVDYISYMPSIPNVNGINSRSGLGSAVAAFSPGQSSVIDQFSQLHWIGFYLIIGMVSLRGPEIAAVWP